MAKGKKAKENIKKRLNIVKLRRTTGHVESNPV